MAQQRSYRDLVAWQKALALARTTYRYSAALPKEEVYGLRSQLTRAAISVPANIAEGQARHGTAEFLHSLSIARGSLAELVRLFILREDLKLLPKEDFDPVLSDCAEVGKLLTALMHSLRR